MSSHQRLEILLLSLFSADELRRFIRYLPGGDALTGQLPGATASPAALAGEAVAALARTGVLADPEFWRRLRDERPRRAAEIDQVQATLDAEPARPPAAPPPPPAPLPASATKLIVLMVSASPDTHVRLRVDKEFRKIIDQVRASRYRDRFEFQQVQAATYGNLRTSLMEHQPHVLHISAHGTPAGELVFEADGDGSRVVPKKNLIRLLKGLRDRLRLVFLNACHSQEIARDIPPAIDLAIGMNDDIADAAALRLSVAFYEALAYGRTVENALDVALSDLDGDDDAIPQLFPPEDQDPDKKRQSVLLSA